VRRRSACRRARFWSTLPSAAFDVMDTVFSAGQPLATWLHRPGRGLAANRGAATRPETGETYGVTCHLRAPIGDRARSSPDQRETGAPGIPRPVAGAAPTRRKQPDDDDVNGSGWRYAIPYEPRPLWPCHSRGDRGPARARRASAGWRS
jgi:hypothetical protein